MTTAYGGTEGITTGPAVGGKLVGAEALMRNPTGILVVAAMLGTRVLGAETLAPWDAAFNRSLGAPGSPLQALAELAAAHSARRDHESAAWVLREALDARHTDLLAGPDAEARLLVALAVQLAALGRVAEAEDALSGVLRTPRPADVRGRELHVAGRLLLSALLVSRGDPGRAEATLRDAHALANAAPALPAGVVADVSEALAQVLVARGDLAGAQRFAEAALRAVERSGAPPPERARALLAVALVRAARGDLEDALGLLRRAARAADDPACSASTRAVVAAYQGGVALALGRYEDAETSLETALELGQDAVGADHPVLVGLMRSLADAYRSRGRLEDARSLEARLERVRAAAWAPAQRRAAGH